MQLRGGFDYYYSSSSSFEVFAVNDYDTYLKLIRICYNTIDTIGLAVSTCNENFHSEDLAVIQANEKKSNKCGQQFVKQNNIRTQIKKYKKMK